MVISSRILITFVVFIGIVSVVGAPSYFGPITMRDSADIDMRYNDILEYEITDCSYLIYSVGATTYARDHDGNIISSNADPDVVIQAAIDDIPENKFGKIVLKSLFDIDTTLTANKNVYLTGIGWESGLTGTADPLIKTDNDQDHFIRISDIQFQPDGTGNCTDIIKTWSATNKKQNWIDRCLFNLKNEGLGIYLYGCGLDVNECIFNSSYLADPSTHTSIGIELQGDMNGGAMGLRIDNTNFENLKYGVYGHGSAAFMSFFAGHHIQNSMFGRCEYGIYLINGELALIENNQLDYCHYPIIYNSYSYLKIQNNWLASFLDNGDIVSGDDSYYSTITGNTFYWETGTPGDGIHITATHGLSRYFVISNNMFHLCAKGVFMDGTDGVKYTRDFTITGNSFLSCTTSVSSDYSYYNMINGNDNSGCGSPFSETNSAENWFYGADDAVILPWKVSVWGGLRLGNIYYSYTNNSICVYDDLGYWLCHDASEIESSGSSTGTGGEQTIAHGLGSTPKSVTIVGTGANSFPTIVRADNTNIYPTVPLNENYNWEATI